jgi:hypothetical protein
MFGVRLVGYNLGLTMSFNCLETLLVARDDGDSHLSIKVRHTGEQTSSFAYVYIFKRTSLLRHTAEAGQNK